MASAERYALLGRAKRPEVDYDMLRDRRGVAQGPLRTRHILEALSNRAPNVAGALPCFDTSTGSATAGSATVPHLRSLSNLPPCGP